MLLLSQIPHGCESGVHDFLELLVDFIFCPAYRLDVLYPLKIGDDNTTGICKNIRYDQNTFFGKIESASEATGPFAASTISFA